MNEKIRQIHEKIKEYERENQVIIFTKDTHFEDYMQTQEGKNLPAPHCIKGTKGHDIPSEILRNHDFIIEKLTFGSKDLVARLAEINFDEVELVGLCTDICVVSNALLIKAFFPEKRVSVDSACCAGVTPKSHDEALSVMKFCQIAVK